MDALAELGDALIDAGWFEEALALAERVPGGALQPSQDLARRARAGLAALSAITGLLRELPRENARFPALIGPAPIAGPGDTPQELEIRSLDALLEAFGGVFERASDGLDSPQTPHVGPARLEASPRIAYGWVGQLLHPGRYFSKEDEALGRGAAGTRVPGISEEFDRLGRFAVIGDLAFSGPPDGTILELVHLEERAGEHLGRPWSGTVAWCEGADFHGGAARQGAAIGGAALHEGYFIDIEVVRNEFERWRRLAEHFAEPDGAARVHRALAVRGVPLGPSERWTSTELLLGEADRMRLAVLADRATGERVVGEVTLGEFVEFTALHEEGHLCDRAQFYPVSKHLWGIFRFALGAGLSPARIAGDLEYRAQLVAMAVAPEPRIGWAEILAAAETGPGVTPHAAAYARLLRDLLAELERAWDEDPSAWPQLDPDRMLGQQLHHLEPEALRALSVRLARKRGLAHLR